MEFMAMGVPVVVSDTCIDQYYFNDQLVQFFDSDDVADLAHTLLMLIHNPDRRIALVAAANRFIASNNWDVKKAEYLTLIDRLLIPDDLPNERLNDPKVAH
jgi:glycosyltransferase involved in cell wall biosynthesis